MSAYEHGDMSSMVYTRPREPIAFKHGCVQAIRRVDDRPLGMTDSRKDGSAAGYGA